MVQLKVHCRIPSAEWASFASTGTVRPDLAAEVEHDDGDHGISAVSITEIP